MRVRVLRRAQQDLAEIQAWLAREAEDGGAAQLEALLRGFTQLGRTPLMGPVARDPRLQKRGYRTLLRGRYVAFYRVVRSTVYVLRVLHERRSWRHLL